MQMKLVSREDLEELINIRLRFLKHQRRRIRNSFIIISLSILILTPIDILISMITNNIVVLFLLLLIIISSAMIMVGVALFSMFAHSALRINYISLLDMIRLLMFFATVLAAISTLLWALVLYTYVQGGINTEILSKMGFLIYYTDEMVEKLISFSMFLLTVIFIMHRETIRRILKIRVDVLYVLALLNFLALIHNITLTLPFTFFVILKPKIIYVFAYTDIKKLMS